MVHKNDEEAVQVQMDRRCNIVFSEDGFFEILRTFTW